MQWLRWNAHADAKACCTIWTDPNVRHSSHSWLSVCVCVNLRARPGCESVLSFNLALTGVPHQCCCVLMSQPAKLQSGVVSPRWKHNKSAQHQVWVLAGKSELCMECENSLLLKQNWEAGNHFKLNLAIIRRRPAVIGVCITCIEEILLRYNLILFFVFTLYFIFFSCCFD